MNDFELLLQENIGFIVLGLSVVFLVLIVASSLKNRGKIKVRVKTPLGERYAWRKPEEDGETIVMRKKKKSRYGWKFKFNNKCLVPRRGAFGNYFCLDIFPEARKAIEYDYEQKKTDQPRLTKREAAEINRLNAFMARYSRIAGMKSSPLLWILIILVGVSIVLQIIGMRGVRIG